MPWAKEKPSMDQTEIFVRLAAANWILKKNDEPSLPLLIFDKVTHQFIGGTGYHHYDWDIPCIEIGYWIRTQRSGQGLMTEAVNALTRYAIEQLSMKRITITCDVKNSRSKKIPENLGYHLESIAKANRITINGEVSDTLIFVKHNLENLPDLVINW